MESNTGALLDFSGVLGFDVYGETQSGALLDFGGLSSFDPDRFISEFAGASTSAYLFRSGLMWSDYVGITQFDAVPEYSVDSGEILSDVRFAVALMEMEGYNPNPNAAVVPASESAIEGLEKVTLDATRRSEFGSEQCSICLDGFFDQDDDDVLRPTKKRKTGDGGQDHRQPQPLITITRLPCSHHYHTPCIVQWLEINHMCPMCRSPICRSTSS